MGILPPPSVHVGMVFKPVERRKTQEREPRGDRGCGVQSVKMDLKIVQRKASGFEDAVTLESGIAVAPTRDGHPTPWAPLNSAVLIHLFSQ